MVQLDEGSSLSCDEMQRTQKFLELMLKFLDLGQNFIDVAMTMRKLTLKHLANEDTRRQAWTTLKCGMCNNCPRDPNTAARERNHFPKLDLRRSAKKTQQQRGAQWFHPPHSLGVEVVTQTLLLLQHQRTLKKVTIFGQRKGRMLRAKIFVIGVLL